MVAKCAYISFCACFGTLARLYTDDIGPASNVALQGSFLANSIGSFALGALASSTDRETIPDTLYAGLTVVRGRRAGDLRDVLIAFEYLGRKRKSARAGSTALRKVCSCVRRGAHVCVVVASTKAATGG